ncbi:MAG: putative addiction module antidote protein [Caldilinea sp. CFX5]|nr:putative addiction module antidote protein [Caldilinea sp. CFX5]
MNAVVARYEEGLQQALQDPAEAAAYLDAALAEGDLPGFLLALRDVAEARGMSNAARAANLNRENLYRMLGANGNPQLSSLTALLHSCGLRLAIEVDLVNPNAHDADVAVW